MLQQTKKLKLLNRKNLKKINNLKKQAEIYLCMDTTVHRYFFGGYFMKIDGFGTHEYKVDNITDNSGKTVNGKALTDAVSFGSSFMNYFNKEMENSSIIGDSQQTLENLRAQADVLRDCLSAIFNKMGTGSVVEMNENGVDINNTEADKLITVVEQIQIKLAMCCDDFQSTVNIDSETVASVIGQGAAAFSVSRKMTEAGMTPNKENVSEVLKALEQASELTGKLTDGTKSYLLKNKMTPSINNMYIAEHAGTAYTKSKGISNEQWNNLQKQTEQIITNSGLNINRENLDRCKWLLCNDIPVTEDNLIKLTELEEIGEELEPDKIIDRIIANMIEGNKAVSTILNGESLPWEETEMAINTIDNATASNIMALVKSDLPYTLDSLSDIELAGKEITPDYGDDKFVRATRELWEARLMLTIKAGRNLEKNGISINTTEISDLVENLRQQELSIINDDSRYGEAEFRMEDIKQANDTVLAFMTLRRAPSAVIGSVINAEVIPNINNLARHSPIITALMEKAGEQYEALSTEIRSDLGDSVSKAVKASTNDILADLGYENNDANRRAVRILAYNSMEMTVENIDKVKALDSSVNNLFEEMTPEKTLYMIRDGINPMEADVNVLSEYLMSIHMEIRPKEEKYSEFLYRMDKKGEITAEEREKFIGIYSLAHRFKKDGMNAIGSLINQGLELNMGNLLTAFYSRKDTGMELTADDNTDIIHVKDKVTYYKNLFSKAADKITPDKLAEFGEDVDNMSIETFAEKIMKSTLSDDVIYEKQLADFEAAANMPEAVYKFVADNHIPATLNNIFAAKELLNSFDKAFDGCDEEEPDRFLEALDNKDTLLKEYDAIAEGTRKLVEEATYSEEGYIDMETLRMLGNRVNLMRTLSRQNYFYIPFETDNNKGIIHLKVMESGDEKGIFNIKLRNKSGAEITIEGKVDQNTIKASVMCDDENVIAALSEQRSALESELYSQDFNDVAISINEVKEQPEGIAVVKENVATGRIFGAAKIFISKFTN